MTEAKPFPPLIVHERGQIASLLAARRAELGLTCEDLDARVGFSDRYAAKLEHPSRPQGRQGFHFDWPSEALPGGGIRCTGMAEVWLQGLGLRLLLVDAETAERIGATQAPAHVPPPFGNRGNSRHHSTRRHTKGRPAAMSLSQVEALDRTLVARDGFKSAIADHPFVQSSPALKDEAEAITELLGQFLARIRAAE
jgi:hypothetical protein